MSNYTPKELDQIFEELRGFVVKPEYKLKVIDLRKFIDEVYPREADTTHQDLADLKQHFVSLNKRVSHIEECLGIDFKLDGSEQEPIADPPVEYNFIKDDVIRDKITAYYREMLRYLYGTRNHKICFGEFCRLATIQIEFMLNYFFADKVKIQLITDYFYKETRKKWEENGMIGSEPSKKEYKKEDVFKIDLYIKSYIFNGKYLNGQKINYNTVINISKWIPAMRNRKSHGSETSITPYEDDYLTEDEKSNLEKWEKELIEKTMRFNKTHKEKITFDKRDKRLKANSNVWNMMPSDLKDLYNKNFSPLQWVSEKSFKDVHDFLRIIAGTCAKELKK